MCSYVRDAHPFHTERLIRIETQINVFFFCVHTATIIIADLNPGSDLLRGGFKPAFTGESGVDRVSIRFQRVLARWEQIEGKRYERAAF